MKRFTLSVATDGNNDIINLSPELGQRLRALGLRGDGMLFLFVVGSTAALTTLEFEPGLVKHDLPSVLQRLIPDDARYEHEETWNDDNGHSHVRAALIGASLAVPVADGKMMTGEYQQVVLDQPGLVLQRGQGGGAADDEQEQHPVAAQPQRAQPLAQLRRQVDDVVVAVGADADRETVHEGGTTPARIPRPRIAPRRPRKSAHPVTGRPQSRRPRSRLPLG